MKVTVRGSRWASLGARLTVEVTEATPAEFRLRAPLYHRALPVSEISTITCHEDDGMNHGLVNWFVTGHAASSGGVRLNTGGRARVEILTQDGRRYVVVVDHLADARAVADAVEAARARESRR